MCTKWHPDESDRLHCIITSREARLGMFLASLLRRIAFSYYDYKAYNFNIEKTDFVVIHIPDQIGDAMAIFPVIRALELHKIKHLLIVTSTINLEVFNALKLEKTKLTLVTMTMQDHATLKEIKDLAKNITQQYGTPDLCIEAMRKKNLKTMIFVTGSFKPSGLFPPALQK
ncbi:hypothetical protein AWP48_05245 [Escherichia coli]|nr:hypothetical protein AWP48_05245 [Escherichia coli]